MYFSLKIITVSNSFRQLVHKVNAGQQVEDAVEDIITRGVNELRRTAFGEDAEDAKTFSWSREQAWALLKQLAKKIEVGRPYLDAVMTDEYHPPDSLSRCTA